MPDPLGRYRSKRDFSATPEPEGTEGGPGWGAVFVAHLHGARTLHFDLRLEMGGVLKSWAVPKGPSFDPEDKRLSVHVEDHPLEYAGFEGVIPQGEYGAGPVMVWDRGLWVPQGDPKEGYRKGSLKFTLAGRRLRGSWALFRAGKGREKDEWLLGKEPDGYAGEEAGLNGRRAKSIVTGRTLEVIKASGGSGYFKDPWTEKRAVPDGLKPELATLSNIAPEGSEWLHEIKYDGYRLLARIDGGRASLFTRNGNDWTGSFPSIAGALEKGIGNGSAWLDGEAVCVKADGTTDFGLLQEALSRGDDSAVSYIVFDLQYYNGFDVRGAPLGTRKAALEALLKTFKGGRVVYGSHVEGMGTEFFSRACARGVEGVVSKRRSSTYVSGRGRDWIKTKCRLSREFVIGGFTAGKGGRGFGALLLGLYDQGGRLVYSGRVGTGFSETTLAVLSMRLKGMETEGPAFSTPPKGPDAKGVKWVRPELVAEVEFIEWTRDGIVRQASFKGLREDKSAPEVTSEEATMLEGPKGGAYAGDKRAGLTNPQKVYYPETGITKRELADFYETVGPLMLAHVEGRPLTLVRCPEGYGKACFFQKHAEASRLPEGIRGVEVEEKGAVERYMAVTSVEGLAGLVQMGALEIHTWGSRAEALEYPDKLVFDIDPAPGVEWERIAEAALLMREVLKELGLKSSYLKTTGGKGLHVVVPVEPAEGWEGVRSFSRAVAEFVSQGLPGRFTSLMSKSRRTGKIFIDYMRNIRGATAVEVYSTRANPGAPVSAPVGWDEVFDVTSASFNVRNMRERLASLKRDPWEGYFAVRQRITGEMKEMLGVVS